MSSIVIISLLLSSLRCFAFSESATTPAGAGVCTATSCKNKNIAVFGGTGRTGSECVYQALNAGSNVFVLARDPSKLKAPLGSGGKLGGTPLYHPKLKVYQGDVTNAESVDAVFSGNDIDGVVVALGGRTSKVGPTMLTDGTTAVINAMKRFNVKRISVVTSIGTGDSESKAPWMFRALMYTVMRKMFKDKNNQEALFLDPAGPGHNLEYTIVRPGGLGEGAPTGVVNVNEGEAGSIHRADLASFILRSITEPAFPYLRQTPGVSSVLGTGWVKEKGFDAPSESD